MEISPKFIEDNWPLSHVVVGNVLQKTGERVTGTLTSSEGKFIYKIAAKWKTNASLQRELYIFDYLKNHGFLNASRLQRTQVGEAFYSKNDQHVFVLEFVEGEHPPNDPETWKTLGEMTAKLHNLTDFPYETEFDTQFVLEHHFKDRVRNQSFADKYLGLAKTLPDFSVFPKALIHTDIGIGNAIQRPDGPIILIDWDDVGVGAAVLDLGFPLIQQFVSTNGQFNSDNACAFYSGYFAYNSMTEDELNAIFNAALFRAMDYIAHGNEIEKRWVRIQWALANRTSLEGAFRL